MKNVQGKKNYKKIKRIESKKRRGEEKSRVEGNNLGKYLFTYYSFAITK